jgi:hypothetical protein
MKKDSDVSINSLQRRLHNIFHLSKCTSSAWMWKIMASYARGFLLVYLVRHFLQRQLPLKLKNEVAVWLKTRTLEACWCVLVMLMWNISLLYNLCWARGIPKLQNFIFPYTNSLALVLFPFHPSGHYLATRVELICQA